jgi:Domain of unknown function (DUF3331)
MENLVAGDVLQHMLVSLRGYSARCCIADVRASRVNPEQSSGGKPPNNADRTTPALRANMRIVETRSGTLVAVSWSASTSGRCAEQLWKLDVSRKGSICSLTGSTIRRGDKIYRPYPKKKTTINAGWVVLASALQPEPSTWVHS